MTRRIGNTVVDLSARHESARYIAAMVLLFPPALCALFAGVFWAFDMPRIGIGLTIAMIGFCTCAWIGRRRRQRATEFVLLWGVFTVFIMAHVIPHGEFTYPYYCIIQFGAMFIYGIRRLWGVVFFAVFPIALHALTIYYTLPTYSQYLVEPTYQVSMNFLILTRFVVVTSVICLLIVLQQKNTLETEAIIDKSIEATHLHEQRLSDIVTAIQEAIWLTDATGKIVLSNPALVTSMKNRFNMMFDNRFDLVAHFDPQEQELWHEQYKKVFRHGESVVFTTSWSDKAHQSTSWWEITLLPLRDGELVYGSVGVGREITEQKEFAHKILSLNHELSEITARLAASNEDLEARIAERTADLTQLAKQLQHENIEHQRTKNSLASALRREKRYGDMRMKLAMTLSHQFRTPITYIKSGSDLIDAYLRRGKEIDEARLRNFIRSVDRGTADMEKLMNDISNLLETQAELQTEQPTQFQIAPLVQEALTLIVMSNQYSNTPSDHEVDAQMDSTAVAFTRPHALRTALIEILQNAVQYSPKGSKITITFASAQSLETNEKIYSISIHNTGSSIPQGEEQNIFEFFYRAGDEHAVGASRSLGIGLGLAKYAVELLGGSISSVRGLQNEAKFTVSFPQRLPANLYEVSSFES